MVVVFGGLFVFLNRDHNTITLERYLFAGILLFLSGMSKVLAHSILPYFCPSGALSYLLGAKC